MAEVQFLNDITRFEADFVVSEQDFRESMRMAMFETMMEMLGETPPEVGIQLLDLVMEYFDVPGKEELVARIRKINGHRDPDKPMSPEEQQEAMAAKQAQAEQQALARAQMIAAVREAEGKARAAMANGEKLEADAMARAVESIIKAMEGAGMVLASPGIAPRSRRDIERRRLQTRAGPGGCRTDAARIAAAVARWTCSRPRPPGPINHHHRWEAEMPAVEHKHEKIAGYDAPANGAETVAPSDSADLTYVSRAIYVGGAGNVAVAMWDNTVVTFLNVPAGTFCRSAPGG
jgi:hypothetical protein